MVETIINKILDMLKEADVYSINRVLPAGIIVVLTLTFLAVTAFLLVSGDKPSNWQGYGDLCTAYLTSLGISGTWLTGNKITNSKYNTELGKPGKPLNKDIVNKTVTVMDNIADTVNKYEGKEK